MASRWASVPELVTPRWPPTLASRVCSTLVGLAAIVISARVAWTGERLLTLVAATVVVVLVGGTRRWSVPFVALVGGVLAAGLLAPSFGVLAMINLSAALLAVGRLRTPAGPGVDGLGMPARTMIGIGLVVSGVLTIRTNLALVPAVLAAAGIGVGLMVQRRQPARLTHGLQAVDRGAGAVGRAVAGVLSLVLVGPLILLIWFGQRLTRLDPLRSGAMPGTNWVTRFGGDPAPYRAYALVDLERHRPGLHRVHAWAAGLVSLLVVALVVGAGVAVRIERVPDAVVITELPPAAVDEPWYPDLFDDLGKSDLGWSQAGLFVTKNVSTRYVNVTDGRRRSWQPPACDCPTVRVWAFGGSTGYGYFQRDDHTLSSELARLAFADGVRLEVTNFSVPAYTLWQEVARFQYLLTIEPEAPELVLFYDGANELGIQIGRNIEGYGDDESPGSALDGPMRVLFPRALGILGWSSSPLDELLGATVARRGPTPYLPPEQVAEHALARYSQSVDAARTVARGSGVEAAFSWQPLFDPEHPQLAEPEASADGVADEWGATVRAAASSLPAGITNLSTVLDDLDRPVYLDQMHLNEYGTRVVAAAWYEQLRPTFDRLADG
jgi:hypothetical protein